MANLFDDELHGRRAPLSLQQYVTYKGGKNHSGIPMYRVVWAPSVRHKSYGVFTDWDEHLEPSERGGLAQNADGSWEQNDIKPQRVVEEMRWLETYPYSEGWLLERWYPRTMFGPPEKWRECPLLGPYPDAGRYVDCCNPIRSMPTVSQIDNLIEAIEYKIANKEGSMQQRVAKRYENLLAKAAERKRQAKEFNKSRLHDRTTTILGSSLEAGRIREGLANRMRARGVQIGHCGN